MFKLIIFPWAMLVVVLGAGCASLQGPVDQFASPIASPEIRPEVVNRAELIYQLLAGEMAGKRGLVEAATELTLKRANSALTRRPQRVRRGSRYLRRITI